MVKKKPRIVAVYDPDGEAWETDCDIYVVDNSQSEWQLEEEERRDEALQKAQEDEC